MKITKYLLMSVACLGMLACNKEKVEVPGTDEGTKSVAISLNGLASTKAPGAIQTAEQIALSNVTIYFTDASGAQIYHFEKLSSSESEKWTALTTTGYIFHKLPSAVEKVTIVGNDRGISAANMTELKKTVMKVSAEQDVKNVTLFGEGAVTPAEGEECPDHSNLYTATVELKPLVARFEIGNIACTDVPSGAITKYSLDVIGLINFNSAITLDGTTVSLPFTLDNILAPGSPAAEGSYIFGEVSDGASNDYTDVKWAWDKITDRTEVADGTDYNPAEGKFVYQFVPNKVNGSQVSGALKPQIKLVLKDITWSTGAANPFDSVVTASFNTSDGKPLVDFEAGKIYTVDYRFDSGNVGPWNPEDVKCVQLVVKVASWEVVPLTPVFE